MQCKSGWYAATLSMETSMIRTVYIAPNYVSFYISSDPNAAVPVKYGAYGVFGTRDCLVVTCQYGQDGDTRIRIGPTAELPQHDLPLRFDGQLATSNGRIVVFETEMPEIITLDVPSQDTRIRIWSNHESQPDVVVIGLG